MSDKEYWENIVSGKDLKRAQRERNRSYTDRKIRVESLPDFEKDGWEEIKRFKDPRYIKVRKPKPIGERFENAVWLMLFHMGFTEMNRDDKFVVSYSKKNLDLTQQIDVFAADEETALIVECKSAIEPGTKKDFKKEIEAFENSIQKARPYISQRYKKVKIKVIWATSNIRLGSQDQKRLDDAGFEYFDEETVDYYTGLAKHLGSAAKYQLLGRLFRKQKIKNMPSTVPAIRGHMGGHTYYSFSIEPERLLKIGYVLHRSDANRTLMPTYQRIIKKSRLKTIREFVAKGGYFPNSVIISLEAPKKGLQFDLCKMPDKADSDTQLGILHLPQLYCSAYIIDGQHRLYGYSDSPYARTNTIPVVAFENLDKKEQVKLFMEINENQKQVPKNLRNTLNADMLWDSDDYKERRRALRLRIAEELGEEKGSPLFDRIIIGENPRTETRCITMESIEKGLREGDFFTKFSNNKPQSIGIFDNAGGDNDYSYKLVFPFLDKVLTYISEKAPEQWKQGSAEQGILTINSGMYAILRVLSDVCEYLAERNLADPKVDDLDLYVEKCKLFLDGIAAFYCEIEPDLQEEIRKQYGDSGPVNHWRYLQKSLHDRIDDFNPKGLTDWWADNSKEHNDDSKKMLDYIAMSVKGLVEQTLESIYGDGWRTKGIPVKLKINNAEKVYRENDRRDRDGLPEIDTWDCLSLNDYAGIATSGSNWSDGFKEVFIRPEEQAKRSNKEKNTKWIRDMAKYQDKLKRAGTSITRSEYEYISSVYQWLRGDTYSDIQTQSVDG